MKCGKCQQSGPAIDLDHVRACYAAVLVGAGANRAGGNGNQWRMGSDGTTRPIRDAASGTTADDMFRMAEQKFDQAERAFDEARRPYGEDPAGQQYQGQRLGVNRPRTGADWSTVNHLRRSIKPYLYQRHGRTEGSFAIRDEQGVIKFYEINTGKAQSKYANHVFVSVCASDDRFPVKAPGTLEQVLRAILQDPQAARELYASELGHCYVCHKELTDEESRAAGIGPVCAGKYL